MVRRSDRINDRQAELLKRIADGDTLGSAEAAPQRITARALQTRGLVAISKRGGVFIATVTDVGRYYLEHGQRPESEPEPEVAAAAGGRTRSAVTDAKKLIERLRAAPDETVRISEPDEKTRAAYRRAIHAAKRDGLVPKSRVLRHTGRSAGDIVVRLLDADKPDETDWNRVRLKERKPEVPPQDLHQLLTENPAALEVSDSQRERALRFLLALNKVAKKHDQEVRLARRGRHAKLGYRIGAAQWQLALAEEYVDSRGNRVEAWEVARFTYRHVTPTGNLRLIISSNSAVDKNVWTDEKRRPLERQIDQIVADVSTSFADAARRAEENHRKWLAEMEEWERQEAEERREWEAVLSAARPKAVAMLQRHTLVAALHAWHDAQGLRQICAVLADAAVAADADGDPPRAANLRSWCATGLALADRMDPTADPASLGDIDFDVEPGPDDLRPFMAGWSPNEPGKDYSRKSLEELAFSRPWPAEWEIGRVR
ncbi:hypothetical protein [Nocardia niigatensis]